MKITSHCQGQPQSCLFHISILNIFYLIRFPVGWGKLPFLITSCYPRFPSPHPQYIFCHACLLFCVKRLCMPGGRLNVTKKKKKGQKNPTWKQNCGREAKTLDYVTVTNQWVFLRNISLIIFPPLDVIIQLKLVFQEQTSFYVTMFYTDSSSLCLNYLREQIAAKCTSDGPSPASSIFLARGKLQKHPVFCCCLDVIVNNAQCPQDLASR